MSEALWKETRSGQVTEKVAFPVERSTVSGSFLGDSPSPRSSLPLLGPSSGSLSAVGATRLREVLFNAEELWQSMLLFKCVAPPDQLDSPSHAVAGPIKRIVVCGGRQAGTPEGALD